MGKVKIKCSFCGKVYFRYIGRVNEAKKFGWKQYCSKGCQNQAQLRKVEKVCANPDCKKVVSRLLNQFKKSKSGRIFCSSSCAAIVNNSPRRKIKICSVCGKQFYGERKYCAAPCYYNLLKSKPKVIKVPKKQIIKEIKEFYKNNERIPLKREYHHYVAARLRFGTWNKAIESAGFEPNPVKFAKKCIAKDGHICNSLAEKIIDDWFYERKIDHEKDIPYPGDKLLTVDFKAKNYWVEFFGLAGELKDYDEVIKRKKMLSKKYRLQLIEIYPKDLFPVNNLLKILKFY